MLNDEADMPLEQLLARYGFVTGNDAAEAAEDTPPAAGAGSAGVAPSFPLHFLGSTALFLSSSTQRLQFWQSFNGHARPELFRR